MISDQSARKPAVRSVPKIAQSGQALTEYILIISLVALVSYGVVMTFGKEIENIFKQANSDLADEADS